ncbi:MAG: hypothetical protein ACPG4X_18595 [Pikeienuella sp.]
MFESLKGKKAYIVGGLMVLNGIAAFAGFGMEGAGPDDGLRMVMEGFGIMTIRAGIAKVSPF